MRRVLRHLGEIVSLPGLALQLAEQHGDPLLGVSKARLELAQERHAALVAGQALFKVELPALEGCDDPLKLGEAIAKGNILGGYLIGHHASVRVRLTLQSMSPPLTRTPTSSPGATCWVVLTIVRPSAAKHTA